MHGPADNHVQGPMTIPHEDLNSPRIIDLFNLVCMFCFPNVGHVMILLRTVSFKFCLIHMHMYA